MKDPNRLLDDPSIDPLEADLLRLARSEGPNGESRRRILAGLGVAAALGTASHASAAPVATKAAVRAGSSKALKWGIAGTTVVGASVAAFLLLGRHAPEAPQPQNLPAVVASALNAAPAVATPNNAAAPADDSAKVTKLEDLPTLPDSSAAADGSHTSAPSLADEVLAIKGAKSALAAGNAADALHQLDAYRSHFPHGRLTQEATVVRIEALLKSGNATSANAMADKFLAAHADSPYAARVHSLIGR